MTEVNVFTAAAESLAEPQGILWLRVGSARVAAPAWEEVRTGDRCRISIDPGDVLLCAGRPPKITARNVLVARVVRVRRRGHVVIVHLDAGFPLAAKITPSAQQELDLRGGQRVWALFKAWSIRLDEGRQGPRPRFRVSLEAHGPGGSFGEDRIGLLEQIDRGGSISEAARAAGITYRSAWLWVRQMTEAWGRALVARTTGGRGGGGATLTAEGKRLLDGYREAQRKHA